MALRDTSRLLLVLGFLLLQGPITARTAIAQYDAPLPPSAGDKAPVGPKIDEAQRFFALLMAASDAGDREALASFRPYYDVLHGQVFIEDVMSEPAAASAMAREFDKWLTEKALAGSPTAQYWMGERAGMVDHPGDESAGLIEIERWYRAAAEQDSRRRRVHSGKFSSWPTNFVANPSSRKNGSSKLYAKAKSEQTSTCSGL
jgi:hypothetical protein